jgi:hypothetical protein
MLEKDIENLIAQHPDEFFPNSEFTLVGQQIKLGKCYADIIFEDRHKREIIVEVKRGILSRDASGQVMEYYGPLKTQNADDLVELILCANVIPPERKKFLETVGIDCKELGINLLNQIAQKVNYQFINLRQTERHVPIERNAELPTPERIWFFQANLQRYDIMNALVDEEIGDSMHWLVNQHKTEISKGDMGMIWLSGKEAGIYAITEIVTDPKMMTEPEPERKYWTEENDKEGERLRVKMKIIKNLLHSPLTKETIINENRLSSMSVFRQPQGTNFRVTPEEWFKIKALITA